MWFIYVCSFIHSNGSIKISWIDDSVIQQVHDATKWLDVWRQTALWRFPIHANGAKFSLYSTTQGHVTVPTERLWDGGCLGVKPIHQHGMWWQFFSYSGVTSAFRGPTTASLLELLTGRPQILGQKGVYPLPTKQVGRG